LREGERGKEGKREEGKEGGFLYYTRMLLTFFFLLFGRNKHFNLAPGGN
jgi:hypothetical protein